MVYTYMDILFNFQKEGNPTICDNMDEPWGHNAKWNEQVTEGQILHDSTGFRYLMKGSRIFHPKIWLTGYFGLSAHKDYLSWLFWEQQTQEKFWKQSRSYPFVREIYMCKGNLCLWGCLPLSNKKRRMTLNHKRILPILPMEEASA